MTSFIAIYHGKTIGDAQLIAVSADASIVTDVSNKLLETPFEDKNSITRRLEKGRRSALREIIKEGKNVRNK